MPKAPTKRGKRPFVMLATPMYGGMTTGFFMQSVCQLQSQFAAAKWQLANSFVFNESLITRARNALVHQFLKTQATHLLFIDADIRFQAEHIMAMVMADVDVVCGIYPKKEINWHTVERAVKMDVPVDDLKKHTASFVLNLLDNANEITVAQNKPFEILAGGTGCMLIKREVLTKMALEVPSYTNDMNDLAGQMGAEKIREFFATSIDKESNRLLSEDYHFCFKWREMGGKIHAAPWVKLSHVGTYIFEGGLLEERT